MVSVFTVILKMSSALDNKFSQNASFQRVLKDALAIQDRFQAEPVYSRTGRGFLKSSGVSELQEIKNKRQRKHLSHGV